jgi:hypothetical protein
MSDASQAEENIPSNINMEETLQEMDETLLGPIRPIYVGPYRNPRALQWEKDTLEGDLKDLEVGKMICVLAKDCIHNRKFWLAKVERVKSFTEERAPHIITIIWYACKADETDPFAAKYFEELQPLHASQRSKKGKQKVSREDLDVFQTTILSYNFELTKGRTMFKATIKRIQLKLADLSDSDSDTNEDRQLDPNVNDETH